MYRELLNAISEEAIRANRDASSIRLIAVTKNHPWSEAKKIYDEGCRFYGENRVQEALPKMEEAPADCEWHLIGTLQKKKVNKIIGKFALIHSVDSPDLAVKISEASVQSGVITAILLQVNVSGELSKHGFDPEELRSAFKQLSKLPGLNIRGLMTMAPLGAAPKMRLAVFNALRQLGEELALPELSMGMSGDWREAVQAGATLLRIGSALF